MGFGALTGRMLSMPRSAAIAAASVAAGASLYGVAAGGVVAVDDELRAVTPPARFHQVDYRQEVQRPVWDCPAPRRHAHTHHDDGEV